MTIIKKNWPFLTGTVFFVVLIFAFGLSFKGDFGVKEVRANHVNQIFPEAACLSTGDSYIRVTYYSSVSGRIKFLDANTNALIQQTTTPLSGFGYVTLPRTNANPGAKMRLVDFTTDALIVPEWIVGGAICSPLYTGVPVWTPASASTNPGVAATLPFLDYGIVAWPKCNGNDNATGADYRFINALAGYMTYSQNGGAEGSLGSVGISGHGTGGGGAIGAAFNYGSSVTFRVYSGTSPSGTLRASTTVTIPPKDHCRVPVPGDFSITSIIPFTNQVNLAWSSSNNINASRPGSKYEVYRSHIPPAPAEPTLIATVTYSTTSYVDTAVTCGTSYRYFIKAVNNYGTKNTPTRDATTRSCNSPPNTPTLISPANGLGTTANWVNINPTFTANVSDPNGGTVMAIFNYSRIGTNPVQPVDLNGSSVASGSNSTGTLSPVLADGKYDWRAKARDSGGLESLFSGWWRVKKDSLVPSASCGTASLTGTTITVPSLLGSDPAPGSGGTRAGIQTATLEVSTNGGGSWSTAQAFTNSTASSEEYNISSSNTYSGTGTGGTTYRYRFYVRDAAGNNSLTTNCGSVTIPPPRDYTLSWISPIGQSVTPGQSGNYTVQIIPNCTPSSWSGTLTVTLNYDINLPDGQTPNPDSTINPGPVPVSTQNIALGSHSIGCEPSPSQASANFNILTDATTKKGNRYNINVDASAPGLVNKALTDSLQIKEAQWLQTVNSDFYSNGVVNFSSPPPTGYHTSQFLYKTVGSPGNGASSQNWLVTNYNPIAQPVSFTTLKSQTSVTTSTPAPPGGCSFNNTTKPITEGTYLCTGTFTIGQSHTSLLAKVTQTIGKQVTKIRNLLSKLSLVEETQALGNSGIDEILIFFDGDLTITGNLDYSSLTNKAVIIIVNGHITINNSAIDIDAYLFAENGITTSNDPNSLVPTLVITGGVAIGNGTNGKLYGGQSVVINFNRNTTNPSSNPAEKIIYDPRILIAFSEPTDNRAGGVPYIYSETSP